MTPLLRVGFGLLILVLHAPYHPSGAPSWQRYDLFADPIGWLFILSGLAALRSLQPSFIGAWRAALLAAIVAAATWIPHLSHQLDDSGRWFTSLPQCVAIGLLCRAIAEAARAQDPPLISVAQRQNALMVGQIVLAVLPPVVLSLQNRTLLLGMVTLAALLMVITTVSMFIDHRYTWLGGPGSPRK